MNHILLIEDEMHVAEIICRGLAEEGYKITHCTNGHAGLDTLRQEKVDLLILDILLPQINGLEVCKQVREDGYRDLPILMLTALASAENVALGLDTGADDYLGKPFKLIELKARIRNLMRRTETKTDTRSGADAIYRFADLEMNDSAKTVKRGDRDISLTSTEYRLLLMFLKNPRKVLSRTELLDEVWGINYDIGTNVVDVYVNYLRKKLDAAGEEKLVHTVIGMGYVLKQAL
jgi:DNA-binding response OmpR family regulator